MADTVVSRVAQLLVAEGGKAFCLSCIAIKLGVSVVTVRNASMRARGLPGLCALLAAACDACHRRRLLLTSVVPRMSGESGVIRCMACAQGIVRAADVVVDVSGIRHRQCPRG
jgi:hypothetical protein